MEEKPFDEARELVIQNKFKDALDLLEALPDAFNNELLINLKARLTSFDENKHKGLFEGKEEDTRRNKLIDGITKLINDLRTEAKRKLSQNSQTQDDRKPLPKEVQVSREKLLKSMRNAARQIRREFIGIDDWIEFESECQEVLEQLALCDWDDRNDRMEAYSLISHFYEVLQELMLDLKDTKNENSELFDLIACTNPLLPLMLDDIQLANEGNNRKSIQLAAKHRSLKSKLSNIIEELKMLIEIAGAINWS